MLTSRRISWTLTVLPSALLMFALWQGWFQRLDAYSETPDGEYWTTLALDVTVIAIIFAGSSAAIIGAAAAVIILPIWGVRRFFIRRAYMKAEAELMSMPLNVLDAMSRDESDRYDRIYERYHGHPP